jgi:hypothetical protein
MLDRPMNEIELNEMLNDCPTLYHVTNSGNWINIEKRGILSTRALLELYEIADDDRIKILRSRRSGEIELGHPTLPTAYLRDQLPMSDDGLRNCLVDSMTPEDWYELLNQKVFFWLNPKRLRMLLAAEVYEHKIHDVIEIDTRPLVTAYRGKIWLCPINSGYTKYTPEPRGLSTFMRIDDYPYKMYCELRERGERAVELAIDDAVPDVKQFVKRVTKVSAKSELEVLFHRP